VGAWGETHFEEKWALRKLAFALNRQQITRHSGCRIATIKCIIGFSLKHISLLFTLTHDDELDLRALNYLMTAPIYKASRDCPASRCRSHQKA
jgi:hypothetical protein